MGLLDHSVTLFLVKEPPYHSPVEAAPVYIPTNGVGRAPFGSNVFEVSFITFVHGLL